MVSGIAAKIGAYSSSLLKTNYAERQSGFDVSFSQKTTFIQQDTVGVRDVSEVQNLLGRLSQIDEGLVRFAKDGSTESLDEVFVHTRELSVKLSQSHSQSLFTAKALDGSATRETVSPVADTLKQFQGVLKTFERLLDAAFKRPNMF